MILYKIINQTLVEPFPGWFESNGKIYTNADAETLAIASGKWRELVIKEKPEYDPSTQALNKRYHHVKNKIVLDWDVVTYSDNAEGDIE